MKKLICLISTLGILLMSACTQQTQAPVTSIQQATGPQRFIRYTVQPGDTLSEVAGRNQVSYLTLAKINNIQSPYNIYADQILLIPNPRFVTEQVVAQEAIYGGQIQPVKITGPLPAQNLTAQNTTATAQPVPQPMVTTSTTNNNVINSTPNSTNVQIPAVSNSATATASSTSVASTQNNAGQPVSTNSQRVVAQITWSWPVSGQLVQGFGVGTGKLAAGVQIATAANTKILAAADGTVIFSGDGGTGFGNMVIIKLDNNFLTAYTSLSKCLVQQGQTVTRGTPIGVVGTINGQTQLHFEIRNFGTPVDPANYLPM